MQSSPEQSAPAASEADLAALLADLKAAERQIAAAVRAAGRLASSGVAERIEGGPLDWVISMACRFTGADARMLVGAGEMLAHLPTVDRLFAQGLVSWGQVRRITAAARRLPAAQRAALDARVGAGVERYGGIDAYDPDHLCDAIDAAAEELRGAAAKERAERAAARDNFLAIQGRTDGGVTFYGSGDALGAAPIVNAISAARPVPVADGAQREPGAATSQGRQQFDALHDICAEYLLGDGGEPATGQTPDGPNPRADADGTVPDPAAAPGTQRPTRHPLLGRRSRRRRGRYLMTLHFDLSQISVSPTGVLELNVPGPLPRISAAALELLARDADFQAVLFDGKRPLAVSSKLHAKDVPADVRFAVRARDAGDRWPGSRLPITRTEPHHIRWRSRDGTHDPDNLANLARRHHRLVHDDGWQLRLDSRTGELRITRRHRTWRSLPRTTGLPPANPPPDDLAQQRPDDERSGTLPF